MEPHEPEDGQKAAVTPAMRQWARRSAVDHLSRHGSSVDHLRQLMVRRALRRHPGLDAAGAAGLAEEAVAFCRSHGFIDDDAYARSRVRTGVRKGHSRQRIAAALAARRVEREACAAALAQADDAAAALAFARRRRIGPWRQEPADAAARLKETAAFCRSGFGGSTAFKVMAMTTEEAETALGGADASWQAR